jgi:hypothetical protein
MGTKGVRKMNWIKLLLNKFTGADMEIGQLKLRATMAETDAEELKRTCDDLYSRISEVSAWAANQKDVSNMWYQMALKGEAAYDALKDEMICNRLAKDHLDEQAAIQLEMDGHRVQLDKDLVVMRNSRDHYQDSYRNEKERLQKTNYDLDCACIKLNDISSQFKELKEYKALYFSALEDIRKARLEKISQNVVRTA